MGSFIHLMSGLLLLLAQGRGDLLDTVPTDAYWQAKHTTVSVEMMIAELAPPPQKADITQELKDLESDQFAVRSAARSKIELAGPAASAQLEKAKDSQDPEVAGVAKDLLQRYASKGKDRQVRKLMAIRTLGERKEKAALPALKLLAASKERFVADYAARAIAQIEGVPYKEMIDYAAAEADVALLPANTGIVLQVGNAPGTHLNLALIVAALPDKILMQSQTTREKMTQTGTSKFLEVVERVGNVRLDNLTVAMSDDIGGNGGWVMFIGRGQFDPATLEDSLKQITSWTIGLKGAELKVRQEGDLKIIEMTPSAEIRRGGMTMIMDRDHRLLFMVGSDDANLAKLKEPLLKALVAGGTGKGGIEGNADIGKLLKQVDRKQTVWAVASKIAAELKREAMFAPFDSALATVTLKDEVLSWNVQANGADKEGVAKAVETLNMNVQTSLTMFKGMPGDLSDTFKPLVEMMETIKATAAETTATMVGQVKTSTLAYGLGMFVLRMNSRTEMGNNMNRQPPVNIAPAATGPAATAPADGVDLVIPPPQ